MRDIFAWTAEHFEEQRDPDFAEKMAEVLCVYRQVKILKKAAAASKKKPTAVTIISYDEKPGIQAIETTAPDPTARSACWPASTSSPARSMPWSRIASGAANSSNSSSFSMRPIRLTRRSRFRLPVVAWIDEAKGARTPAAATLV
jgi:hypothetical protein